MIPLLGTFIGILVTVVIPTLLAFIQSPQSTTDENSLFVDLVAGLMPRKLRVSMFEPELEDRKARLSDLQLELGLPITAARISEQEKYLLALQTLFQGLVGWFYDNWFINKRSRQF